MATYYTDQSLTVNGDGSYANPFNTAPTLTRGDEFLFTKKYMGSLVIATPVDSDKLISIGSYGDDPCVFTSRRSITQPWVDVGGGVFSVELVSPAYAFYAGYEGVTVECAKDTTTPTTPTANSWGVSGNTLYWTPGVGYPSPGDSGATFEWNSGSILHGIDISVGCVECSYVDTTYSAYHGVNVSGASTITSVRLAHVRASFNGSQAYTGTRIGNGIAFMYNVDGAEAYRCEMLYNLDHGGNAEGLTGTSPRPKNVLFDWCDSHHNGSRGYAIGSSNSTYPCLDIDIHRGSSSYNGTLRVAIPGTTLTGNYKSGIMYNKARGKVSSCHVHHNQGAGVSFYTSGFDGIDGMVSSVINSTVNDNNLSGSTAGPDFSGISIQNQYCNANGGVVGTVHIKNNIIINNIVRNIAQYNAGLIGNIRLVDNIIYGGTVRDIGIEGILTSPGSLVAGNMFKAGTSNYIGANYADVSAINATAWGDGNVTGVPLYIDESADNYRPTEVSPVIGAGYGSDVVVDADGNQRPYADNTYAIGPYEPYPPPKEGFGPWVHFDGTIPSLEE